MKLNKHEQMFFFFFFCINNMLLVQIFFVHIYFSI